MSVLERRAPPELNGLSVDERLLFLLLHTIVDDRGLYRSYPLVLAQSLFPEDDDAQARIPSNLQSLQAHGLIRQNFTTQSAFIAITNWKRIKEIERTQTSEKA